jgi:hypothetical protein
MGTHRVDLDRLELKSRVSTLELGDNVEHERVLRLGGVDQADGSERDSIRARGEVERDPLADVAEAGADGNWRRRVRGADVDRQVLRRVRERELEARARPAQPRSCQRTAIKGEEREARMLGEQRRKARGAYHHVDGIESQRPW